MTESLDAWLTRIAGIHAVGWDLGLDRVGQVGEILDVKHPGGKVILVAGTNGKGSTCEYLARMSMAAGLKTGKSTSPHLFEFSERIVIDGEPVSDNEIVAAFERVDRLRGDITLTYFEFATLAALLLFKEAEVDMAILEVGLGGRLDAMNIVDPNLCVITSISLDHQSWLGNTREEIGREKAGILRAGVPVVISDRSPPASVIDCTLRESVPRYCLGEDFDIDQSLSYSLPADSFGAAAKAAELLGLELGADLLEDLAVNTVLPGRRTWLFSGCRILLDVAHNPAAAEDLAKAVAALEVVGAIHLIAGIYADKDIDGVIGPFRPLVETWHFTELEEDRAESALNLASRLKDVGQVKTYDKIETAAEALELIVGEDDLIIVMGSFPVVAGALQYYSSNSTEPDCR